MLRRQYSRETVLDEVSSSENSEGAVFDREVQARNVSEGNTHYDVNKQNESRSKGETEHMQHSSNITGNSNLPPQPMPSPVPENTQQTQQSPKSYAESVSSQQNPPSPNTHVRGRTTRSLSNTRGKPRDSANNRHSVNTSRNKLGSQKLPANRKHSPRTIGTTRPIPPNQRSCLGCIWWKDMSNPKRLR